MVKKLLIKNSPVGMTVVIMRQEKPASRCHSYPYPNPNPNPQHLLKNVFVLIHAVRDKAVVGGEALDQMSVLLSAVLPVVVPKKQPATANLQEPQDALIQIKSRFVLMASGRRRIVLLVPFVILVKIAVLSPSHFPIRCLLPAPKERGNAPRPEASKFA